MAKRTTAAMAAAFLFVAGTGSSLAAKSRPAAPPPQYRDKPAPEAAQALLERSLLQAGPRGSWERIRTARAHYLGGQKAQAQAIFDAILAAKHDPSDELRIGHVYAEAGEWEKAQPLFSRYLAMEPGDEQDYEIARLYEQAGRWEMAQPLFERHVASRATDGQVLAAVGAYYLIHGERAKAERMFDRAFQLEQDDPWITACIAGAYLGVRPPPME